MSRRFPRYAAWIATIALGPACLLSAGCGAAGQDSPTEPVDRATAATSVALATSTAPVVALPTEQARPAIAVSTRVTPAVQRPEDAVALAAQPPVAVAGALAPPAREAAWAPASSVATADGAHWQRSTLPSPAPPVSASPKRSPSGPESQPTIYSGIATYYGWGFQGLPMASGPPFDMTDPTITASNLWPLGARLRIWRVPGGPWDATLSPAERADYFDHSIIVTVLDRGLFQHALDLSYAAFAQLGRPDEGVIAVYIQPLP